MASSSTTSSAAVKLDPQPPYSSGTSTPMKPLSKQAWIMCGSILPASSIWRTSGASSSLAHWAVASRIIDSSSRR